MQEQTFLLFVSRPAVHCIERKLGFTGQEESTDGKSMHLLQTLVLRLTLQTISSLGHSKHGYDHHMHTCAYASVFQTLL